MKKLKAGYIGLPPPPGFKPTHVITYGSNANGDMIEHMTNLATGETVSTNMSWIEFNPYDFEKHWRAVPNGYKLINANVERKKKNFINRLRTKYLNRY